MPAECGHTDRLHAHHTTPLPYWGGGAILAFIARVMLKRPLLTFVFITAIFSVRILLASMLLQQLSSKSRHISLNVQIVSAKQRRRRWR